MTQLPQPLSVTGEVTFDPETRCLFARPKEKGLGSLIWRAGHEALSQDDGTTASYGAAPVVYGRVAGRGDVGVGVAVRDQWVKFQVDDATYRALARDGVQAICTVDRQAGTILGVRFIG